MPHLTALASPEPSAPRPPGRFRTDQEIDDLVAAVTRIAVETVASRFGIDLDAEPAQVVRLRAVRP